MTITIKHCTDGYESNWRHGLWKVTRTTDTDHVRRTEGKYFTTLAEAEKYREELENK